MNTSTVFFLTALPLEYKAVKAYVSQNLTEEWNTAKTKVYEIGEYLTPQNVSCRVILRQQPGMGNLLALQETEEAIAKYQPNYLIFVGIAASLKDVDLGDVVVAESVTGYETVKVQGDDVLPRSHRVYASKHLAERARQLIRNEQWLNKIKPVPESGNPKAIVAAIISGEKVIDSKSYLEQLRRHYSDATALEMEGLGFLKATSDKPGLEGIVIRGISDAGQNKAETDQHGWQTIAAHHAAAFAFALLDELLVKVVEPPSAYPGLSTFRPDEAEAEDFSRLKERYTKVFSTTADPEHIALDSRKFAETLCRYLFTQEIGKAPEGPYTLDNYLTTFKHKKLPLSYVYPHLETIQKLGNYAGHDRPSYEPITRSYIQPALSTVDVLMNWYVHTRLQRPNLQFSEGKMIENSLTPPIVCESNNYELEMVGGAIPLNSKFYVTRAVDQQFMEALQRRDSIVLLKGARQVGKTSLLARGIQRARDAGVRVILTDCQKLPITRMKSLDDFLLIVSTLLAKQLKLSTLPKAVWDADCVPTLNFENYFMEHILASTKHLTLWAIDEADYLFHHEFSSEVFALLRSWHNERALNPDNPCHRLTISIAYATESYLFIKDQNQSPFNVGTKLPLNDFTVEQVTDLNQRYGSPLKSQAEVQGFFDLVGGHPYLVRAGLNELVIRSLSLAQFQQQVTQDEGVFGDHLRRIVMLLRRDPELSGVVRKIFHHQCPDHESFYRLRSAGILSGESKDDFEFRCQVYKQYLQRHLA